MDDTRRTFLKKAGVASTAATALPNVVAAKPNPSQVVAVSRKPENPLTRAEIEGIQQRAINQYRKETGSSESIARAAYRIPENCTPVSFVFLVHDGYTRQYVGTVNSPRNVGKIHRAASEYRHEFQQEAENDD